MEHTEIENNEKYSKNNKKNESFFTINELNEILLKKCC